MSNVVSVPRPSRLEEIQALPAEIQDECLVDYKTIGLIFNIKDRDRPPVHQAIRHSGRQRRQIEDAALEACAPADEAARNRAHNMSETPEQRLWRAVLCRAVEDATTTITGTSEMARDRLRDRAEARAWLLGNSKDFQFVCEWGAHDPDDVREKAERLATSTPLVDLLDEQQPKLPAVIEQKPEEPKAEASEPEPEFDWTNDDSVVLHHQPAIAVYFNKQGGLVIRQQRDGFYENEDTIIVITPENMETFLDKLTDACGIPSVGR
jgi:hypothetical protein